MQVVKGQQRICGEGRQLCEAVTVVVRWGMVHQTRIRIGLTGSNFPNQVESE